MVLSTVGCESTSPEVEDTALVTDGTSFRLDTASSRGHLWYHGKIPYSFTNRTGSRVYLPTDCLGTFNVGLQVLEDGEWKGALTRYFVLCDGLPIVIEPDEVYQATLNAKGCVVGNCARIRLSSTASTPYRIKWYEALSSYDRDEVPRGEPIPLKERISNTFTLQVPR